MPGRLALKSVSPAALTAPSSNVTDQSEKASTQESPNTSPTRSKREKQQKNDRPHAFFVGPLYDEEIFTAHQSQLTLLRVLAGAKIGQTFTKMHRSKYGRLSSVFAHSFAVWSIVEFQITGNLNFWTAISSDPFNVSVSTQIRIALTILCDLYALTAVMALMNPYLARRLLTEPYAILVIGESTLFSLGYAASFCWTAESVCVALSMFNVMLFGCFHDAMYLGGRIAVYRSGWLVLILLSFISFCLFLQITPNICAKSLERIRNERAYDLMNAHNLTCPGMGQALSSTELFTSSSALDPTASSSLSGLDQLLFKWFRITLIDMTLGRMSSVLTVFAMMMFRCHRNGPTTCCIISCPMISGPLMSKEEMANEQLESKLRSNANVMSRVLEAGSAQSKKIKSSKLDRDTMEPPNSSFEVASTVRASADSQICTQTLPTLDSKFQIKTEASPENRQSSKPGSFANRSPLRTKVTPESPRTKLVSAGSVNLSHLSPPPQPAAAELKSGGSERQAKIDTCRALPALLKHGEDTRAGSPTLRSSKAEGRSKGRGNRILKLVALSKRIEVDAGIAGKWLTVLIGERAAARYFKFRRRWYPVFTLMNLISIILILVTAIVFVTSGPTGRKILWLAPAMAFLGCLELYLSVCNYKIIRKALFTFDLWFLCMKAATYLGSFAGIYCWKFESTVFFFGFLSAVFCLLFLDALPHSLRRRSKFTTPLSLLQAVIITVTVASFSEYLDGANCLNDRQSIFEFLQDTARSQLSCESLIQSATARGMEVLSSFSLMLERLTFVSFSYKELMVSNAISYLFLCTMQVFTVLCYHNRLALITSPMKLALEEPTEPNNNIAAKEIQTAIAFKTKSSTLAEQRESEEGKSQSTKALRNQPEGQTGSEAATVVLDGVKTRRDGPPVRLLSVDGREV